MKYKILIFCLLTSYLKLDAIENEEVVLNLTFTVPKKRIQTLKLRKEFTVNQLKKIVIDNFKMWNSKGSKIRITCQALTPEGKHIGSFENPDFVKSIPGGQSSNCNIWLLEKKEYSKE